MAPTEAAGNSTLAMGMPLTMLFLEPQKTRVISSSLLKPRRRAPQVVSVSTTASRMLHSTIRPISEGTEVCCHRPLITAALKAE